MPDKEESSIKKQEESSVKKQEESSVKKQSEKAAIKVGLICIIIGFLGSILYSFQAASLAQFLSVLGVATAVAGASLLAGGLLGFLFGIPRTLQHDSANVSSQQSDNTRQSTNGSLGYGANTNLEQISDWLTKILVGVGLTQLVTLPESLQKYADFTAPGLGNFANSEVFAIAQLIFYLICGFLVSYLWTRLYLAGAFYQADLDAIGGKLAQVEGKVSELEKQAGNDANALGLVQRQLHPLSDAETISQEQLTAAIVSASPTVRDHIYDQVEHIVDEYLNDTSKVIELEKTAKVFRALIASDTNNVHQEYHGYLGIVLADQRQADHAAAVVEFTKAIDMRGRWQDFGWVGWEANRAISRIGQDANYLQGRKSDRKFKEEILADLKAAATNPEIESAVSEDENTSKWIKLNEISSSEFVAPTRRRRRVK